MTILYIHQYFALPSSSVGTRSYDLAKSFIKKGHKVVVFTTSSFLKNYRNFSEGWTVVEYEGIEIHVLKLNYSNKLNFKKRIASFFVFFLKASIRILKVKGDIVLATSTPLTVAIPAFIKKVVHKTPFVFEARDVWPEVPIAMGIIRNPLIKKTLFLFEEKVYKNSAYVVTLSEDMERSIISRAEIKNKIKVIPNFCEINRFEEICLHKTFLAGLIGCQPKKVVLYAGTLGLVNGLKYMIDLAIHSRSIDPEITFLIFGDGMQKDELIKYAEENRVLNENFYFFDPVKKSQLPQIYYESLVGTSFVAPIPELWANSANKFFDCLAAGRPIVINHRGWQAEVIENENLGFVLDFRTESLEQEARRFCDYLNDTSLLEVQGRNSKRIAKEKYSLSISSEEYLKVFNGIVPKVP